MYTMLSLNYKGIPLHGTIVDAGSNTKGVLLQGIIRGYACCNIMSVTQVSLYFSVFIMLVLYKGYRRLHCLVGVNNGYVTSQASLVCLHNVILSLLAVTMRLWLLPTHESTTITAK